MFRHMSLKLLTKHIGRTLCVLLLLFAFGCSRSEKNYESGFKIVFFSVGHGDSALVMCDGHNMMIDCGTSNGIGNLQGVYTYLETNKIDHFDYLICSHPDADHYNGYENILKKSDNTERTYDKVLSSVTSYDTNPFNTFAKQYNKNLFNKISKAKVSDKPLKLGSANVYVLASDSVENKAKTNNRSVVLMIEYQGKKFLFPGDAEWDLEKFLIDTYDESILNCDVLKVAHHGSDTSTYPDFLHKCTPSYAIFSVSQNDQCKSIDRLVDCGVDDKHYYRTDEKGNITCSIENGRIVFYDTDGKPLNNE